MNKFIFISGIMVLMFSSMSSSPKAQATDCGVTPLSQKVCDSYKWKDVDAYITQTSEDKKRDILTEVANQYPGLLSDLFLK